MTTPPAGPQEDETRLREALEDAVAHAVTSVDDGGVILPGQFWGDLVREVRAALSEAAVRGGAPAALRELIRDLDEELAGTEDWADYTTTTFPITLARRLRVALSENTVDSLDDAWKAAETVLPEGWSIDHLADDTTAPGRGTEWRVQARGPYIVVASGRSIDGLIAAASRREPSAAWSVVSEIDGGAAAYESRLIEADGATPAAALRALARSLSATATSDASEEET